MSGRVGDTGIVGYKEVVAQSARLRGGERVVAGLGDKVGRCGCLPGKEGKGQKHHLSIHYGKNTATSRHGCLQTQTEQGSQPHGKCHKVGFQHKLLLPSYMFTAERGEKKEGTVVTKEEGRIGKWREMMG